MGLDGFWPGLKKHPHVFKVAPISSFRGKRILIDGGTLLYDLRRSAWSKIIYPRDVIAQPVEQHEVDVPWLILIIEHLTKYLTNGITPVIVFDGISPKLKDEVKAERVQKKASDRERLQSIIQYGSIMAKTLSERTALLKEAKELLINLSYVPRESAEIAKNFLFGIGIPILQSKEEAERLCSALSREGYGVVFSSDGDVFAHLSPAIIRGISDEQVYHNGCMNESFDIVFLQDILKAFMTNETVFQQACVLGGCDYNRSGRLDGVAFTTAIKHLKTYGSLDFMSQYMDITSINHKECLDLFSNKSSIELIDESHHVTADTLDEYLTVRPWNEVSDHQMSLYRMEHMIEKIEFCIGVVGKYPPTKFKFQPPLQSGPFAIVDEHDVIVALKIKTPTAPGTGKKGYKKKTQANANLILEQQVTNLLQGHYHPPQGYSYPQQTQSSSSGFLIIDN